MLIPSNEIYLLLPYLITIIVSIITAKILGLPMMPNEPKRYSFELTALYPTPILALGIFAIIRILGFSKIIYNEIISSIILAIIVAIFTKYLFYYIFPKPQEEGDN